jgi:hypothetical protein
MLVRVFAMARPYPAGPTRFEVLGWVHSRRDRRVAPDRKE